MKLEWPIFTSTSPLLLFRPMLIRLFRIIYSKSLPSNRAIAWETDSAFHDAAIAGLLRDKRTRASISEESDVAMLFSDTLISKWLPTKAKQHVPRSKRRCLHPAECTRPRMHRLPALAATPVFKSPRSQTKFFDKCHHHLFELILNGRCQVGRMIEGSYYIFIIFIFRPPIQKEQICCKDCFLFIYYPPPPEMLVTWEIEKLLAGHLRFLANGKTYYGIYGINCDTGVGYSGPRYWPAFMLT